MFLFLFSLLILSAGCISTEVLGPRAYPVKETTLEIISNKITGRKDKNNYHIVRKGDTLWSIARKYGMELNEIVIENDIDKNKILKEGDKLVIPYSRKQGTNKLLFLWPVKGKIVTYFGERIHNKVNKGIDIQTKKNDTVKSAATGRISFSNYLKGYGNTLIVKHTKGLSTVYTHLARVFVKENDYVKRNQTLGTTGIDPKSGTYLLHFEIRNKHKAENPLIYLGTTQ